MPGAGRSYYPNVPGALEQALVTQLGTNPWAPAFYTNAQMERRNAINDVNETQASQFLTGLQAELQKQKLSTLGSAIGEGLRGGHAVGPLLSALNTTFGANIDPSAINQEQALASASQVAGVAKTTGEASNSAVSAGTPIDLNSLNNILPGLLRFNQGTPTDITKEGMQDKTTLEAARIHANATLGAAAKRGNSSGGKGTKPKATMTYNDLGGPTLAITDTPENILQRLSPEQQSKVVGQTASGINAVEHNAVGNSHDASGDAVTQDPELAHQQKFVTDNNLILKDGHGDPRAGIKDGRIGKFFSVVKPDGTPTQVFVPNKRQ